MITPTQRKEIAKQYKQKTSIGTLATKYGVSRQRIFQITQVENVHRLRLKDGTITLDKLRKHDKLMAKKTKIRARLITKIKHLRSKNNSWLQVARKLNMSLSNLSHFRERWCPETVGPRWSMQARIQSK
jgi:predicted DNA-binding protein YlxM (UPF0122 family)